jgi:isopenicillin-N N-acyltransferase-like protein
MIWLALILILLAIILFFAFVPALGNGDPYLPSLEEANRLKETTPVEEDSRKTFGHGSLEKRGDLYVLKLRGSPYEMGYQHGALLEREIRQGAVPFYDRVVDNVSPFKQMGPVRRWFLAQYFDWAVYRPLLIHSPRGFVEELKGLADGSGLPFPVVFRGNMLSELNMNLEKRLSKAPTKHLQRSECTSFAAFGEMTPDGGLIVGRNTDYWGVGLWDQYHTVMFYEPAQGFRFANVSSAGLLKCNACMNEKGICLGGHFLFSDDVQPEGAGFTALEIEIMKNAASVDDAYRLVADSPRAGAFAYLVADGQRGDAGVIEASASTAGLRRAENGQIWETNFGTTEAFRPHDLRLRYGIGRNPVSRYERMRQLLDENRGQIDPQKAAHFMGDHWDVCAEDVRPSGLIISTLANVTSAVFDPTSFDFWVAAGPSPAANNPYTGFNLMRELDGDPYDVDPPHLTPNPYVESDAFQALRNYYDVMVRLTIPPINASRALEILQELVRTWPNEGGYRLILAKLLLKRGQATAAREHLVHTSGRISASERAQIHLLIGFTHDLEGTRNQALMYYHEALRTQTETEMETPGTGERDPLRTINPFVLSDARKHLRTPFTIKDAAKIEVSPDMSGLYDR